MIRSGRAIVIAKGRCPKALKALQTVAIDGVENTRFEIACQHQGIVATVNRSKTDAGGNKKRFSESEKKKSELYKEN